MARSSVAIIDLDYYLLFDQNTDDAADYSEFIMPAILTASTLMEQMTGRKFITDSEVEIFAGNGMNEYYVKQGRILDSPTPALYYWDDTDWTAYTDTTLYYDGDGGLVYLRDGYTFYKSSYGPNWKIIYDCGWTQASMPADVKNACATLAKLLMVQADKIGIASENFGDVTATYNLTIPKGLREQIERYKVYHHA